MNNHKMFTGQKISGIFLFCIFALCTTSCKKFVEIDPPKNELITATVFTNDASAHAAMKGLYSYLEIAGPPFMGGGIGFSIMGGLLSDELYYTLTFADYTAIASNSLESNNSSVLTTWNNIYSSIYRANGILEGLQNSSVVSQTMKTQLAGEAKFIRAFCHFYLANLYGDVPLVLTTDYRENMIISRTAKALVYEQVLADLKDAETVLGSDYSIAGGERVRVNKWAAKAMLARVYLYLEEWSNAEVKATEIINNTGLYSLRNDLNEVFLKNSTEAIWQLFPQAQAFDSREASLFIPGTAATSIPTYPLKNDLVNAFEPGDARRINWVGSKVVSAVNYFYPFKYKIRSKPVTSPNTEYSVVLRLAEQYLIRAEARARQGKITGTNGAEWDINAIRFRASLPGTTATTQSTMLLAIENERRFELFSELGHRWFDLIRTNRAGTVLVPIKPDWQPHDVLLPIPEAELNKNPRLTQNPGYF